jgi:hypothetical protein
MFPDVACLSPDLHGCARLAQRRRFSFSPDGRVGERIDISMCYRTAQIECTAFRVVAEPGFMTRGSADMHRLGRGFAGISARRGETGPVLAVDFGATQIVDILALATRRRCLNLGQRASALRQNRFRRNDADGLRPLRVLKILRGPRGRHKSSPRRLLSAGLRGRDDRADLVRASSGTDARGLWKIIAPSSRRNCSSSTSRP